MWSGPGRSATIAVAVRQPQGPPVGAVPPFLHAGHRGRGQVAEQAVRAAAAAGTAAAATAGWPQAAAAPPAPRLARRRSSVGDSANTSAHRVVERPDAGEPGRERHVGHRQRGGLDQQPGGLRPLRPGQRQRPGAELGEQLPLDLPDAVAEPGGQPGHPAGVDHPVGDQPHGPGDQVGPLVPQRRAGAGVRPAPLAGPEAGLLGGGGAGVEAHVLRLGRHHRAAGPAVDPGGRSPRCRTSRRTGRPSTGPPGRTPRGPHAPEQHACPTRPELARKRHGRQREGSPGPALAACSRSAALSRWAICVRGRRYSVAAGLGCGANL